MGIRSKVSKLGYQLKAELIDKLAKDDFTIDELHLWLQDNNIAISRSAVGRYSKKAKEYFEQTKEIQEIAKSLAKHSKTKDEIEVQSLIANMLNASLADTMLKERKDGKGIKLSELKDIARILRDIAQATKDRDKLLQQFKEDFSKKLDGAGKKVGLTNNTINLLKVAMESD